MNTKKTVITILLICSLIALLTGCVKKQALPEWFPEGSGDCKVNRFSAAFVPGGEGLTSRVDTSLFTAENELTVYCYNPQEGLVEEEKLETVSYTVREMARVYEALTVLLKENLDPSMALNAIVCEYQVYSGAAMSDMAIEQTRDLSAGIQEGELYFYYTYSLSKEKMTPMDDTIDSSRPWGILQAKIPGLERPVRVFIEK